MRGARLRHTVRNKGMLIALFGHLLFRHVFSTCQTPKFFRLPGLAVPNSLSPASTVDSVRRAGSNSPPRVIFDSTGSYAAAFTNGLAWNALNIAIMAGLLIRSRQRLALA